MKKMHFYCHDRYLFKCKNAAYVELNMDSSKADIYWNKIEHNHICS